jgi:hypothetical protein
LICLHPTHETSLNFDDGECFVPVSNGGVVRLINNEGDIVEIINTWHRAIGVALSFGLEMAALSIRLWPVYNAVIAEGEMAGSERRGAQSSRLSAFANPQIGRSCRRRARHQFA